MRKIPTKIRQFDIYFKIYIYIFQLSAWPWLASSHCKHPKSLKHSSYGTGRQTIPDTDCRREKGSLVGVYGTILYQESLLMPASWYTSGCQVLVCWEFDKVIDNPIHHCDFVLFSPWLKVLPTKFLQHWSDTAGSAVVIVAKPGGTPLYRLHFVGFCYRVPYRRSIFKLWTNYGRVAVGLDILWTARKISTEEGCSLIGLFRHYIDMAVPGQSIVYSDSNVLGFRSFIQGLSMNVVGSLKSVWPYACWWSGCVRTCLG